MRTLELEHYVPSANLSWREVHGELVAINADNGEYHIFNSIGKLVWLSMEEGQNVEYILDQIQVSYNVDRDTALADLNEFIVDLFERKLLNSTHQS